MSRKLFSLNPDLKKLRDEGYFVQIVGGLLLMREVGRHLVERGEGGRIVNVSSSSAFRAKMSQPAYGSSKAALVQLTRSVAAVYCRVCPSLSSSVLRDLKLRNAGMSVELALAASSFVKTELSSIEMFNSYRPSSPVVALHTMLVPMVL